jgi:hypothetical protein
MPSSRSSTMIAIVGVVILAIAAVLEAFDDRATPPEP